MAERKRTTCNRDCPDACSIIATVEDGRVTRLQGDPEHPVTRGFLCYRTNHFLQLQYGEQRLKRPLVRSGGALKEASFEAAIDHVAEALVRIRDESGPASIFHYRSGGSLGITKVVTDYFFERFGPVTIKRGDICSGAGDAAQELDFGLEDANDLFDLPNARNIILWGKNVATSSPHTIPLLKRARKGGSRLLLIDPILHKSARLCDDYLAVRPGGDFALAMAVCSILFARGWVDGGALERCDNVGALRALADGRSIEAWCAEADVGVGAALDLAERFRDGPTTVLIGWGMGRRRNGGAIVRAIDALVSITGNLGIRGGGASFYFHRRRPFDTSFVRGLEIAPRSIREPCFADDVLAATDPPIRAIWITAGNPVAMLPDSQKIADVLRSRELVVVVDPLMTDTAEVADVVFPTTTLLEDSDVMGAYGHHWIAASRPVVPPPPGVRSDLQIMQELAERVGLADDLSGSAEEWQERVVAPRLGAHGISAAGLAAGAVRNPLAPEVLFEGGTVATETGRVSLIVDAPPPPPEPTEEYPLILMALSTPEAQGAQWVRPRQGPALVTVHPDASAGIGDGERARLCSATAALEVEVRHDPQQRRDVALMAKGGHHRRGQSANALIHGETTDLGEGGALYDTLVRLERG